VSLAGSGERTPAPGDRDRERRPHPEV